MKARMIVLISALALMLILFVTCRGPSSPHADPEATPPLGKNCTIQFRRDALGSGAGSPVPPLTSLHNGADVSLNGKLKNITPEWIVLDRNGTELWIPKSTVLLLQY